MNKKAGDIIRFDDKKFIILSLIEDNNKNYVFVNQVNDAEDDITEDYYLVEINNGNYTKIVDENEIQRLFPKVQEQLKKEFESII